jgi:hypothetical protein
MIRRIGTSALCLVILAQLVGGCASMSEEQKGAGIGSAVGALAGGLAGAALDRQNPGRGAIIGITAGALLGAAAGWGVGAYRAKQIRTRDEAVKTIGYTPRQGVVATIEDPVALPQPAKPGSRLTFQAGYTVLAPAEGPEIAVRESGAIYFNEQLLNELPQKERRRPQGTDQVQFELTVPRDAAEGAYTILIAVEPLLPNAPRALARSQFMVRSTAMPLALATASAEPAGPATVQRMNFPTTLPAAPRAVAPEPVAATRAVPPEPIAATRAPAIGPEILRVKAESANIREGASPRFPIVARAPQGAIFTVLETTGPPTARWYRVKLENGNEGWIAGSAVVQSP